MNGILFYLAILLVGLAGLMILPALSAALAGEPDLAALFLSAAVVAAALSGTLIAGLRGLTRPLARIESLVLVLIAWPVLALVAAVPIAMTTGAHFGLALFDAVSALTTTGFTTFRAVDDLPGPLVLWRAVLQWYGGFLTLLMLTLVLAPMEAGGLPHQRAALVARDLPRPRGQVEGRLRIMVAAYSTTTLICLVWLLASGVDLFEALCLAFATVSTGGLAPRDAPIGTYVPPIGQIGLVLFMIVGATSIVWQGMIVRRDVPQLGRHRESYAVIIMAVLVGLMIAELYHVAAGRDAAGFGIALREGLFAGASLVSTTGFQIRDESLSVLPLSAIFVLALVGGGAMSTAGGLKLFRIGVLLVHSERELTRSLFPHGVQKMHFGGRSWRAGVQAIYAMVLSSLLVLTATILVLSFSGMPFAPAVTASVAALSNVGPIYGAGPEPAAPWPLVTQAPGPVLVALSAAMIVGRVEVLALFGVLNLSYWRRR